MDYMAENGYGIIREDLSMEFVEDDFVQQEAMMNLHWHVFSVSFTANNVLTAVLGGIGAALNIGAIAKDVNALRNASKDELADAFRDVGMDLLGIREDYWGNEMLQNAYDVAAFVFSALDFLMDGTTAGRIKKILAFLLSHWFPGLLKGVAMVIGGIYHKYGCNANVGLWWSTYDILRYRVTLL